jgi:hypothetical protein
MFEILFKILFTGATITEGIIKRRERFFKDSFTCRGGGYSILCKPDSFFDLRHKKNVWRLLLQYLLRYVSGSA